jgi:hypothetical protein
MSLIDDSLVIKGDTDASNSRIETQLHGKRYRADNLRTYEKEKDKPEGDGLSPGNIKTGHELQTG